MTSNAQRYLVVVVKFAPNNGEQITPIACYILLRARRIALKRSKNANRYRLSLESHLSLCFTAGRNITGCYCGCVFYLDISRNFSYFQRTRALVKFLQQMTNSVARAKPFQGIECTKIAYTFTV